MKYFLNKRTWVNISFSVGLVGIFASWMIISWKRWPDCLVDFGRELYIPWQISQGKILYKDFLFAYGPLVKYFHAFLFKIFGTSLDVIITTNFIILFLTAYLLFKLFKFFKGTLSGLIAIGLFWGIYAFGRYSLISSNYISPYSHELVYGFALSLTGLLVIAHWLEAPKTSHLVCLGLLTGLLSLTKIEVFVAFTGALGSVFILTIVSKRMSVLAAIKNLWIILCFALIPPGIFFIFMSSRVSFQEAGRMLLLPWTMIPKLGIGHFDFYKVVSGLDNPLGSFEVALLSVLWCIFWAFLLGILSWFISQFKAKNTRIKLVLLTALVGILIAINIGNVYFFWFTRGVPLILVLFLLIKYHKFLKKNIVQSGVSKEIFQIALAIYSLILIFKIFLNCTLYNFAFVLALPGTIITALMLTNDVACFGRGKFWRPHVFRALSIIFLVGLMIFAFRWSKMFYGNMHYQIAQGKDSFLAEDPAVSYRSSFVNYFVQWLDKNTSAQDTVVVIPEGVMVNYLSRRKNPVPICEFAPGLVALLEEDKIIDMISKAAPSYIILDSGVMIEQPGLPIFGNKYGGKITKWISKNYKLQFAWGESSVRKLDNDKESLAMLLKKN